MIRATRAPLTTKIAASLMCLAVLGLIPAGAAAAAEGTHHHRRHLRRPRPSPSTTSELAAGKIQAVTVNKRLRSLRVTLKDGQKVLVHYLPHEEPNLASELQAKHVTVTILAPTAAKAEQKAVKPVHHKLRYIAGGILLVVIIVVGAVLVVNRRRSKSADY